MSFFELLYVKNGLIASSAITALEKEYVPGLKSIEQVLFNNNSFKFARLADKVAFVLSSSIRKMCSLSAELATWGSGSFWSLNQTAGGTDIFYLPDLVDRLLVEAKKQEIEDKEKIGLICSESASFHFSCMKLIGDSSSQSVKRQAGVHRWNERPIGEIIYVIDPILGLPYFDSYLKFFYDNYESTKTDIAKLIDMNLACMLPKVSENKNKIKLSGKVLEKFENASRSFEESYTTYELENTDAIIQKK